MSILFNAHLGALYLITVKSTWHLVGLGLGLGRH